MNPFEIPLTEEDITKLKEIIERKNPCDLDISKSFNSIWYRDMESETELRLLFLGEIKLTISRVAFKNKRVETMTDVYEFLKEICVSKKIAKLVVQSVETPEMAAWCLKNEFQPNQCCIEFENFLAGDYEIIL